MTMPDTYEAGDARYKHLADLQVGDVFAASWTMHRAYVVLDSERDVLGGPGALVLLVATYPDRRERGWKPGDLSVRHVGRDTSLTAEADGCTVQDNPQANHKEPEMTPAEEVRKIELHGDAALSELPQLIAELVALFPEDEHQVGKTLTEAMRKAALDVEWRDHQGTFGPFAAITTQVARALDRAEREAAGE